MNMYYKAEHIKCRYYDGAIPPIIEVVDLAEGEKWNINTRRGKIIIVLEGELHFSTNIHHHQTLLLKKDMVYLPVDIHLYGKGVSPVKLIIFRIDNPLQFCDCYNIENLMEQTQKEPGIRDNKNEPYIIKAKRPLWLLIEQMYICLEAGLKCTRYLNIKINEIFFMFRAFYPKRVLASFFSPALTRDSFFFEYVTKNYHRFVTVSEFAKALNYTLSGFEKRFNRTFGTSPYQWMIQQKANKIFHDINVGNKKIKALSEEYGFSSPSAFNDFCKKYLNATPGMLRKQHLSTPSEDKAEKLSL